MQNILSESHQENINRGIVLLISGGATVLLKWVLPAVAPLAVVAYGIYRLYTRNFREGGIAIMIALLLWLLRHQVGWLLWAVAALMTGLGLFLLIAGLRDQLSK